MKKIEHIGIAVKDLDSANLLFSKLLGKENYKIEEVKSEGVRTSFFIVGESKIELLQASSYDSSIAKFISKKGEGIHHIAFYVDDLENEIERLKGEGAEKIISVIDFEKLVDFLVNMIFDLLSKKVGFSSNDM